MKKILVIERDKQMDHLYLEVLKGKYEVEFVCCIDGIQNRIDQHQDSGGLEYYDVIIMDPYFSHYPLYDFEETFAGMQTGWFVYRDFMKNLTSTVIIWTHPVEQYNYNERNYPERSWGENVAGVFEKDYTTPYLLHLVEKYARKKKVTLTMSRFNSFEELNKELSKWGEETKSVDNPQEGIYMVTLFDNRRVSSTQHVVTVVIGDVDKKWDLVKSEYNNGVLGPKTEIITITFNREEIPLFLNGEKVIGNNIQTSSLYSPFCLCLRFE